WDVLLFWEYRGGHATLRAGGVVPFSFRVAAASACRRALWRGRGADVRCGMASDLPDFHPLACLDRSWRISDLFHAAQRAHGASRRPSSAAVVTVRLGRPRVGVDQPGKVLRPQHQPTSSDRLDLADYSLRSPRAESISTPTGGRLSVECLTVFSIAT